MCRRQANHRLRRYAIERAVHNGISMADGATCRNASVAKGRTAELGRILNGRVHTGVTAHVATLTTQRTHWNMGTWRSLDRRRHCGHCKIRRICSAVALRTVCRARGRVSVNVRYGRHHREVRISMACRAGRTRLDGNMIRWHGADREIAQTGMTVRTLTCGGVRGISHIESSSRNLWTCLKALERCTGCNRVLTHAHPDLVGVMA